MAEELQGILSRSINSDGTFSESFQVNSSISNQIPTLTSTDNSSYTYPYQYCWDWWWGYYFPVYCPVWFSTTPEDKGKKAIQVAKALMNKGILKPKTIADFVAAIEIILKAL